MCGPLSPSTTQPDRTRRTRLWTDPAPEMGIHSRIAYADVTLWYPTATAREIDLLLGPPQAPVFPVGRPAEGATLFKSSGRHPLVVLSHGKGGSGPTLAWLAEAPARKRFAAAVNHYSNTGGGIRCHNPGGGSGQPTSHVSWMLFADPELGNSRGINA